LKTLGFVFFNLTQCNHPTHRNLGLNATLITKAEFDTKFEGIRKNVLFCWQLLAFGSVLFLQISFIFFESGSVSTKTTQAVLNKSTFVFVVSALTWYCFGFGFAN